MALHWFNPPVYVRTDRPGIRFGVSHVEGVAEQLLKWTKRGPKWRHAVETCMAAMEGNVPSQDARKDVRGGGQGREHVPPRSVALSLDTAFDALKQGIGSKPPLTVK